MEITEVRIKLMDDSDDRLQAFCSITFDDAFVVRDLKIIDGSNGPFVAMPSRKLTAHCPECGSKNHMRANYCNQCGKRQSGDRASREGDGRAKLYADIAHPINSACREMIQARVISEFHDEVERAKSPGYISRYDDEYDDFDFEQVETTRDQNTMGRWDQAHASGDLRSREAGKSSSERVSTDRDTTEQSYDAMSNQLAAGTKSSRQGSESDKRPPLKGPHSAASPSPEILDQALPAPKGESSPRSDNSTFGAGIFDD